MATDALLRCFVLEIAGGVTRGAGNVGVRSVQRETGLLRMIELGALPVHLRMALAAFLTARAAVHVIGRVTVHTAFRCAFVARTEMAGVARDLGMRVAQ